MVDILFSKVNYTRFSSVLKFQKDVLDAKVSSGVNSNIVAQFEVTKAYI